MIARVVEWAPTAAKEFDATIRYLEERSPQAASQFADAVQETIAGLARRNTGRPGRVEHTFEKSLPRYSQIIAFAYREGGVVLEVLHIIHTARDWPAGVWPADE